MSGRQEPEAVRQELDGLGREGQEGAGDHVPVPLWNDADGDAVPRLQGSGGALLLDRYRSCPGQEIAELLRLAGPDLAHLVEADRSIPEPLDVRPRQSRLFPSPPFEVEVRDVVAARAVSPSEEVLEGAAPEDHRPGLSEEVSQFLEVHFELLEGRPEVLVKDLGQAFAPDLVAKDEADQTVEVMCGAHSGKPCSTETIQV
jgi:hypothetical protein